MACTCPISDICSILKSLSPFKQFSQATLEAVAKKFDVFEPTVESILCEESQTHDSMYILLRGRVQCIRRQGHYNFNLSSPSSINTVSIGNLKNYILIAELTKGDGFGFLNLVVPEAQRMTVAVAEKGTQVGRLTKLNFQQLLAENAELSSAMVSYLTSKLPPGRRQKLSISEISGDGPNHSHVPETKMVVFDTREYDRTFFDINLENYKKAGVSVEFFSAKLSEQTVNLAQGATIISVFVNDVINSSIVNELKNLGVEHIALRCAGFNNVDLQACNSVGLSVTRVPAYSPNAVAEHAIAMIMTLNRKIHLAYNRTRCGDFTLSNGLLGMDMCHRVAGIVGTGKIGKILVKILLGFGTKVVCYDIYKDKELLSTPNVQYVDKLEDLLAVSDIISLHSPLMKETHHMINDATISKMKPGVMLINTSRGGLVDTNALIRGLKNGQIGSAGVDVYEDEGDYFFSNWSEAVITDDVLARLMTFQNVIVTGHQAFFTKEALTEISNTVFNNVSEFMAGKRTTELTNNLNTIKK